MALNKAYQYGMTLLELLVAMTLMVVISALSYASLNGLIDAKTHTDKVAKAVRIELLTSQQLYKDIHGLINRKARDELGTISNAVVGKFTSIQFNRNGHANPLNQLRSDLQRIQWFVRDNVLYRRSLNMLDIGSFPQWNERKYLENVDSLNISYTNSVDQESRFWPVENNQMSLKFIQFTIIMQDETVFKYLLAPKI